MRGLVDFALNNRFMVSALAILLLVVGRDLVSQPARRSLPGRREQLRPDHHPVARPRRRRSRAASHRAHRSADERPAAPRASPFRFAVRTFVRDADLRRRFGQRLEPRQSSGAPLASHAARRPAAADGHRLVARRPNLLVHAHQHQSEIRLDGPEVHRGLAAREAVQVRARTSWTFRASAASRANIRCAWIPTRSSLTA